MENNDLKEKVRKKIKEKIAISVIKEELNQNNKVKRYSFIKKTITIAASLVIIIVGTVGVYAVCGGTINGKPVIEWLGIRFSENYEEYKVDVQNEEISNNETSISLVGTVCDEGFTILEFDVRLSNDIKEKLKIGEPVLTEEYMNIPPEEISLTEEEKNLIIEEYSEQLIDSIYISFNNELITDETGTRLDNQNNYTVIIDGKEHWIRPRSAQVATKISDNEYKVYQLYFLTDEELGDKKEFNITLNNPVITANYTQFNSEEIYIPIDGQFNASVSKEKAIQNTDIFIPNCEEIKHKNMISKVDKVINTPLQTIVKVSYTYNNINLKTLTDEKNDNYIDILEYNAYDENGNEFGTFAYETKRKIIYENGKSEEWEPGDIATSKNFNNAKMERTEYIIIEKKENNSKVRIELKEKLDNKAFGSFEINLENK